MSRKKKKLSKNKKKFFIILACYVLTFVITSVVTASTMAWFNSSTWQSDILYMGGPVYMYFSDDSGVTHTSGQGQLVTETPPNWTLLYPGMNINFQARAVMEGHVFTHTEPNGETFTQYTTGGVLRAKIRLEVTDPDGNISTAAEELYNAIWPQLKNNALNDMSNEGMWVMDTDDEAIDVTQEENYYFYYAVKTDTEYDDTAKYSLLEVGGQQVNVSVGFLNNTIIQIPPVEFINEHADCKITFIITFEAVQAFFPYENSDVGVSIYQNDDSGRLVTIRDVGLGKPLTIGNSRKLFKESQWTTDNGWPLA